MEITLIDRYQGPDDLIEALEGVPGWAFAAVRLELRKNEQAFRTLEPTIVVAIVSAAGGALGALLTGVFALVSQSGKRRIVLQDKDGRRIEIDGAHPEDRLEGLIEDLRKMEKPHIEIIGD